MDNTVGFWTIIAFQHKSGFWIFLVFLRVWFDLVFVCHHRFLKHRLGSGFGFHKDKYLKANCFNLKKKLTDIGFGFLNWILKRTWFLFGFWILTDMLFINQLLTQRCEALRCCTRAHLPFYWDEVITEKIVDDLEFWTCFPLVFNSIFTILYDI